MVKCAVSEVFTVSLVLVRIFFTYGNRHPGARKLVRMTGQVSFGYIGSLSTTFSAKPMITQARSIACPDRRPSAQIWQAKRRSPVTTVGGS